MQEGKEEVLEPFLEEGIGGEDLEEGVYTEVE